MSNQTDPKTGRTVPDTATTYERAKPAEESPSKSLKAPATPPAHTPDPLNDDANPSAGKSDKKTS